MIFYVTMTDKFMSGWGAANGKINKMIVECDTIEQAEQIERAARRRSEMKYVNICARRPRYGSHVLESFKTYADLSGPWKA
jgi:hypothetical protein